MEEVVYGITCVDSGPFSAVCKDPSISGHVEIILVPKGGHREQGLAGQTHGFACRYPKEPPKSYVI